MKCQICNNLKTNRKIYITFHGLRGCCSTPSTSCYLPYTMVFILAYGIEIKWILFYTRVVSSTNLDKWEHLEWLLEGSGITPMFQVITHGPKFHLVLNIGTFLYVLIFVFPSLIIGYKGNSWEPTRQYKSSPNLCECNIWWYSS